MTHAARITLVALLLIIPSRAQADPHWALLDDAGSPGTRAGHTMTFDPVRHRVLLFGGNDGTYRNDVWALSLGGPPAWTSIMPAGGPPVGRSDHTAIYDPVGDKLWVFAGSDGSGYRNDVWTLSLSGSPVWTQVTPGGSPPPVRRSHSAIYDPVGQRMIVFGGYTYKNDVWALSLGGSPIWTQLAPSGTPPAARQGHAAVYDRDTQRMIVFGGDDGPNYLGDLWALSLSGTPSWSPVSAVGTPPSPRRFAHAMLDSEENRLVLFGGQGNSGLQSDTWALALGASPAWSALLPAGAGPAARSEGQMAGDPIGARGFLFGGSGPAPPQADRTWKLSFTPAGLPCRDTTRVYTTTGDFVTGTLDALIAAGDHLELPQNPTSLSSNSVYAWLANTSDGTVSKVNTMTGKEVARYFTGPPDGSWTPYAHLEPARVAVDRNGDCWVANRDQNSVASVTQILSSNYVDRDGSNTMSSSSDANLDGVISPAEMLPWGSDERVARHYLVGLSKGVARALTFDKAGYLWVGLWSEWRVVKLDPNLSTTTYAPDLTPQKPPELVSVPLVASGKNLSPYGLACSPTGLLYGTNNGAYAFEVDPGVASGGTGAGPAMTKHILHGGENYGIVADKDCAVWIAMTTGTGCVRWEPALTTTPSTGFQHSTGALPANAKGRGITVDLSGDAWMAVDDPHNTVVKFTHSSGSPPAVHSVYGLGSSPPCLRPFGVGVGQDGNLIVTCLNSQGWRKLDAATGNLIPLSPQLVGAGPYTYSDFTGALHGMTALQQGSWSAITDSQSPGFEWNWVAWNATTPAGTGVVVDARAADQYTQLGASGGAPWVTGLTSGAQAPPLAGRYIETRARLSRAVEGCDPPFVTPELADLTVSGVCKPCMFATCPRDTIIPCTSAQGAAFSYSSPAALGVCDPLSIVCSPASGSTFPIGVTPVVCSAVSTDGDTVRCTFRVTVVGDCGSIPTGGCCVDYNCTERTRGECLVLGGLYLGDGQPCVGDTCVAGCYEPPGGMSAWWPLDGAVSGVTPNRADPGVPGTLVGSPVFDPVNKVNGSFIFNGTTQSVVANDAPSLNFGSGPFTIDAWVRSGADIGNAPIVDKRASPAATPHGYYFHLSGGFPALQIGGGSGAPQTFFLNSANGGPAAYVLDNAWHHVAVTVNRQSASGIKFYVDGIQRGSSFNPIPVSGSLSSVSQLRIGRTATGFPAAHFPGGIDEVELFHRVLRPDEIQGIALAGPRGKCAEGCFVPRTVSCCSGATPAGVTICNYTNASHVYTWNVYPSLGPGCATITPVAISPSGGTVTVPANSCLFVPFSVACPTIVPLGGAACYTVKVFNHDTGTIMSCVGSVVRSRLWCVNWTETGVVTPGGKLGTVLAVPGPFEFRVSYPADPGLPSRFRYRLRTMQGESDLPSETVAINGLPAGTVLEDSMSVSPGGGVLEVPFTLAYLVRQPIAFDRVVLEVQDPGAIDYEVISEFGVRNLVVPSTTDVRPGDSEGGSEPVSFKTLPNPFTLESNIRFVLERAGKVSVTIYDIGGRAVQALARGQKMEAGEHTLVWDGRDAHGGLQPTGVYFLRLQLDDQLVRTTRIVLRR